MAYLEVEPAVEVLPASRRDTTARESAHARILVVDDAAVSRATSAALLAGEGHEIVFATHAAEALELAERLHPDLILLDVLLPGIDGFEVCRQLRADPELADVRVFMLTALRDQKARLQGLQAGADDFITKPFDRNEMLARVRSIARLNRYRTLLSERRALADFEIEAEAGARSSGDSGRWSPMDGRDLRDVFGRGLDALWMAYQPIFRVDGSLFGREALVRSAEPAFPHPGSLFGAAERLNAVQKLGRTIRDQVAATVDGQAGQEDVFVNLHARDLVDDSLFAPDAPLTAHASRVVLEITERASLEGLPDVRKRVGRLRDLGFRIAVDDLGAGYAGLTSFAAIEPDFVKLDMSLVRGVDRAPLKQKVIASMTSLCRDLGIQVVAEGVETGEERDTVTGLGCGLLQGYLLGRPGDWSVCSPALPA